MTYYLRAYATNSEGTAYGNQIKFATPTNNDYLIVDKKEIEVAPSGDTFSFSVWTNLKYETQWRVRDDIYWIDINHVKDSSNPWLFECAVEPNFSGSNRKAKIDVEAYVGSSDLDKEIYIIQEPMEVNIPSVAFDTPNSTYKILDVEPIISTCSFKVEDPSWCRVFVDEYGNITVLVNCNTALESRSTVVKLVAPDNSRVVTQFEVSQVGIEFQVTNKSNYDGWDLSEFGEDYRFFIPFSVYGNETQELSVRCNTSWVALTEDESRHLKVKFGQDENHIYWSYGDASCYIHILEQNNTTSILSDYISVLPYVMSWDGAPLFCTAYISIHGIFQTCPQISDDFGQNAGVIPPWSKKWSYNVYSNVYWNLNTSNDWLTDSDFDPLPERFGDGKSVKTYQIFFTAPATPNYPSPSDSRTTFLRLSSPSFPDLVKSSLLIQVGCPGISIHDGRQTSAEYAGSGENDYFVNDEGKKYKYKYQYDYSVSILSDNIDYLLGFKYVSEVWDGSETFGKSYNIGVYATNNRWWTVYSNNPSFSFTHYAFLKLADGQKITSDTETVVVSYNNGGNISAVPTSIGSALDANVVCVEKGKIITNENMSLDQINTAASASPHPRIQFSKKKMDSTIKQKLEQAFQK